MEFTNVGGGGGVYIWGRSWFGFVSCSGEKRAQGRKCRIKEWCEEVEWSRRDGPFGWGEAVIHVLSVLYGRGVRCRM